ncbi:MAG: hypothetical protein J5J06_04955 [Phycisphaerae bacterium]|nr:hypothetical protein [Phycisphaerae bacterium]
MTLTKELRGWTLPAMLAGSLLLVGCSGTLPWPPSPLYETPTNDPDWQAPANKAEAMATMAGHYAHYDIVAYEGETANGPLSSFVVSYGFTDLVIEDGELVAYDSFCHAEYIANQPFDTIFSDAATQAIQPPGAIVDVYRENGAWKIWRPATPTLNGIDGDPSVPLSMDRDDPLISDDDNDGKPGVTVVVILFGLIRGEIYIARRDLRERVDALLRRQSVGQCRRRLGAARDRRIARDSGYAQQSAAAARSRPESDHSHTGLAGHRYVRRTHGAARCAVPARAQVLGLHEPPPCVRYRSAVLK